MSDSNKFRPAVPSGLGEPPKLGVPVVPVAPPKGKSEPKVEDAPQAYDFSAANAYSTTVEEPVLSKRERRTAEKAARPQPTEEELAEKARKRKKALTVAAGITAGVVAVGGFSWWAVTRPAGPDPQLVAYTELADKHDLLAAERATVLCASVGDAVAATDAYARLGESRAALLGYTTRPQFTNGQEVPPELSFVLADAFNLLNPDGFPDWAKELSADYVGSSDPMADCMAKEGAPRVRVEAPQERDVDAVRTEVETLEAEVAELSTEGGAEGALPVNLWEAASDDKEALLTLMSLATPTEQIASEYTSAVGTLVADATREREELAAAEAALRGGEYDLGLWVDSLEALAQFSIATENLEVSADNPTEQPENEG